MATARTARRSDAADTNLRFWTPDRVRRLRLMLARGECFEVIAAALGARTRSVIAGKARRLGLRSESWGAAELRTLRDAWGRYPAEDIAASVGKTPWQVRHRARVLGLKAVDCAFAHPPTRAARVQDDAFCAAMMKAIKAGKERAPIGVDTRPCTKNPNYVSVRDGIAPLAASSIADW
jgi:hypothetical protein